MTRARQMGGLITAAGSVLRAGVAVGLALLLHVSVGAAQAPPTPSPDTVRVADKSALTATLLSVFLAGTGHLYAEDKGRGGVLLGMTLTGLALGVGGENGVSLVLIRIPWWYAVIDAHNAVARYNRRHASRVSVVPWVTPANIAGRGDSPRVGVTFSIAR